MMVLEWRFAGVSNYHLPDLRAIQYFINNEQNVIRPTLYNDVLYARFARVESVL